MLWTMGKELAAANQSSASSSNFSVTDSDPTSSAMEFNKRDPILQATVIPDDSSIESNRSVDEPALDGGLRAWLVVLGSFLNFTTAFGTSSSFPLLVGLEKLCKWADRVTNIS